jgi:hypothetical protein
MRIAWIFAAALSLAALVGAAASAPADDERSRWAKHMGDVPFIVGFDDGMKEVEYTGRPPMLFFTMET